MLLVGDIGGTKTTIALYPLPFNIELPIAEMTFKSAEFKHFPDLITSFLSDKQKGIDTAVFGVAGPVSGDSVRTTNLPWNIEAKELEADLRIHKVWLINDLEAIGNSIPFLKPSDLNDLHQGVSEENGALAVIAPGTGLGEAYVTVEGGSYFAHPSEGGHADFAPTSSIQIELLEYMLETYDHVSYERLCSGIGIPNIYSFLKFRRQYDEPNWLTEQLSRAKDPTPVIVSAAANEDTPSPICDETVRLFTAILGAECGNLALKHKATGGVYVGGGMILKMLDVIDLDEFARAYTNKGRFSEFVSKIPIRLILHPNPAIVGAAHYGQQRLGTF